RRSRFAFGIGDQHLGRQTRLMSQAVYRRSKEGRARDRIAHAGQGSEEEARDRGPAGPVLTTLCRSLPERVRNRCPVAHGRTLGSVLRPPIMDANGQRILPSYAGTPNIAEFRAEAARD